MHTVTTKLIDSFILQFLSLLLFSVCKQCHYMCLTLFIGNISHFPSEKVRTNWPIYWKIYASSKGNFPKKKTEQMFICGIVYYQCEGLQPCLFIYIFRKYLECQKSLLGVANHFLWNCGHLIYCFHRLHYLKHTGLLIKFILSGP